jgi:hypothetical protein
MMMMMMNFTALIQESKDRQELCTFNEYALHAVQLRRGGGKLLNFNQNRQNSCIINAKTPA